MTDRHAFQIPFTQDSKERTAIFNVNNRTSVIGKRHWKLA